MLFRIPKNPQNQAEMKKYRLILGILLSLELIFYTEMLISLLSFPSS